MAESTATSSTARVTHIRREDAVSLSGTSTSAEIKSDAFTSIASEPQQFIPPVREQPTTAQPPSNDPSVAPRAPQVEDLYPNLKESSPHLHAAIALLDEALQLSYEAVTHKGDPIARDSGVLLLQSRLNDLFLLRTVGDGFALVVSGCRQAILNRSQAEMEDGQLIAISAVLRSVRQAPFMRFEDAMSLLDTLEQADLRPEPKEMGVFKEGADV
jgi:hypothetical protein